MCLISSSPTIESRALRRLGRAITTTSKHLTPRPPTPCTGSNAGAAHQQLVAVVMDERAQQTAAAGPVSGETLLTVSTWATDPSGLPAPGSSLGLAPAGRTKTAPRPRGMKRRRPASLCHRLRLPWPFAARTGTCRGRVFLLDQSWTASVP